MPLYAHRDVVVGEDQRQEIISEFLIPAANIMAKGNFIASNYGYVGQHETLPASDLIPEKTMVSLYAFHMSSGETRQPTIRFTISTAVEIEPVCSQLASMAIDSDEGDDDPYVVEDESDISEIELKEFFKDTRGDGIKVVEYKSFDIDTLTLEPSREVDLLLFINGKLQGTFQTNGTPFASQVEQDVVYDQDLDEEIDWHIDQMQAYWDQDDMKAIHFVLRSLGLYLPRK